MSQNANSTTSNNTRIDGVSELLQEARSELIHKNTGLNFSNVDTARIVLILSLHYALIYYKILPTPIKVPNTLSEIIDDFEDNEWIFTFISPRFSFDAVQIFNSYQKISAISDIQGGIENIVYAFETFEYTSDEFINLPVKKGVHVANYKKKGCGIYYTPEDVIEYMISQCTSTLDMEMPIDDQTYLDCSCGSGVFLWGVIAYRLKNQSLKYNARMMMKFIKHSIWGVDVSQIAIDSCKIAFILQFAKSFSGQEYSLAQLWSILSDNFVCGDATQLSNILRTVPSFPQRYNCIIGNPPYVSLSRGENLFFPFVANIVNFADKINCSALVLPLSICYSKSPSFCKLRKIILNENQLSWSFVNFDRSPDSLFGDQVKTRNCIVFSQKGHSERKCFSTKLQRWTAENRYRLFQNIKMTEVTTVVSSEGIPKISGNIEKEAYEKLISSTNSLSNMLHATRVAETRVLAINGTAYNWICAYDHLPPSTDMAGKPYIPPSMQLYTTDSEDDLYFTIAVLSNRIAYWFWTAIGDGFHVSSSFIERYSVHKCSFIGEAYAQIVEYGKQYCKQITKYPTYSLNCKKRIANYNHFPLLSISSDIEEIIIQELCLPKGLGTHLKLWYQQHVDCGRKLNIF